MAEKEKKTPKRVQRILDAVRGGQKLCRSIAQNRLGSSEDLFFLHPSGRKVANVSAWEATRLLQPSCDGLFGSDFSQTWGIGE